ncbi:MAG: hypothetical protein PHF31_09700 [Methylobacter sp.]|nr:hypothetical protein [Methylobacter sp.]
MGSRDNCFSIPVMIGRNGIIRHLHPELNDTEQQALQTAAGSRQKSGFLLIPDLVDSKETIAAS